ncbi:MAG: HigA family addiction module antidote protein [Desulfobacteraceae bacterium]|nr:HigA family addiction module antidote protein [Desulfobacteraceae bacterium]
MIRIPTHRIPTHPGEMLAEEFLIPMKITQRDIAEAIDVPYRKINELVNRHRAMTPAMALRLSKFFGISADFWMNLQMRWDMYYARKSEIKALNAIEPCRIPNETTIAAFEEDKSAMQVFHSIEELKKDLLA